MPKVLIELKDGSVMNVEATSEDVEIYIVDHDVISDGSTGELKRYLADLDAPIELDTVLLEDELMAKLEELVAEGKARLEDIVNAWEDDNEPEEISDLTAIMRSRR